MTRSRRLLFLGLAAVAILFGPAIRAGMMGEFTCSNKECNFKAQLSFGGGFMFEQVTGYCCKCEKFVYLNWPRLARAAAPPYPQPSPPHRRRRWARSGIPSAAR